MEGKYEKDHELYPERVILGSENFPKEIGFRWPKVEALPYVIGDFTWTAWDYIGEAGIGKTAYPAKDDPAVLDGTYSVYPHFSAYPWRLANDADFDIHGTLLPQGAYRRVVWGSPKTFLFSYRPEDSGKAEFITPWGFQAVQSCWTWPGHEGEPVDTVVYTAAGEVELLLNGRSLGRIRVADLQAAAQPRAVKFTVTYEPGILTAVSYADGKEVSRASLETAGTAAAIRLLPEKTVLTADGHSAVCVPVLIVDDQGRRVPDAAVRLTASLEADSGTAWLAGFGSSNPVNEENYTADTCTAWRGRAMAVLRAGCQPGRAVFRVTAEGLGEASAEITVG